MVKAKASATPAVGELNRNGDHNHQTNMNGSNVIQDDDYDSFDSDDDFEDENVKKVRIIILLHIALC